MRRVRAIAAASHPAPIDHVKDGLSGSSLYRGQRTIDSQEAKLSSVLLVHSGVIHFHVLSQLRRLRPVHIRSRLNCTLLEK